ncbi:Fe(3+)-hydroxamate ABC transporter permease FhuB [Paraburkholderia acidiphila]|uniref:Fe(3+)-hydroxamate ABC transporter permease FhuB n=1 Tax=Paraburkholderia acidiphila TaxID=2571747 RepID=A0A7Z2GAM5_9BURK|nr:Fe(3+)-hydroxamate ABC transporter permease FhuB [Paraburkholderia acidiphila]QGZ58305.1 Fe(3+)-hydroxamate ABC transporter permease FhuB [Paraburkholderia acidiphila]
MRGAVTTPFVPLRRTPLWPVCALFALAALLFALRLEARLSPALWWQALVAPESTDVTQLLAHYSDFPRVAVTLLCGAALGLAGVATQQVLRNPLAEPMTLGVFSGAWLALALATVYAPSLLAGGRDAVALAGAAAALAAVFAVAAQRGMSPLALILAGMIVNLCGGAFCLALAISHYDLLSGLLVWGGGSFAQHDWRVALALAARFAPCALLLLLLLRPMAVFDLGDTVASSLGVSLRATRGITLGLTLLIAAFVVSAVGVIGFVGLAAPAVARLSGARRLRERVVWSPLIGAALLWLADQLAQLYAARFGMAIPTGAITTLIGAPLLLAMLRRLRGRPDLAQTLAQPRAPLSPRGLRRVAFASALALTCAAVLSLTLGRGLAGWHLSHAHEAAALLFLRLPHVAAAAGVGVLLALSGGIVQRMTGNPMASPDLLGISAGGALGLTGALFLTAHPGLPTFLLWCAAGSMLTLCALMLISRASSFAPDTLILAGMTLSAAFQAVSVIAISSGDPRVIILYNLLAGSTYNVGPWMAALVAACALLALAAVPLCRRWLAILPLGDAVSVGLGVRIAGARFGLLMLSALLSAVATLVIGPLSFIGLMAPHMARTLGIRRPIPLLYLGAMFGATLMIASDWLGRWVLFPQEMPAGVMATLLGGLYLILTMFRHPAQDRSGS